MSNKILTMDQVAELREYGISFMHPEDEIKYNLAGDSALSGTTASNGLPAFLLQSITPKALEVLTQQLNFDRIAEPRKVGEWTDSRIGVPVIEMVGSVSAYGDYTRNSTSTANTDIVYRDTYDFEDTLKMGTKEAETMARMPNVNWKSTKMASVATAIKQEFNRVGFFGKDGKDIYGLLTDPSLPAAETPKVKWSTLTPDLLVAAVIDLYKETNIAMANNIELGSSEFILITHPDLITAFSTPNQYGLTAQVLLEKFFQSKIEFIFDNGYKDTSGIVTVQFILKKVNGEPTVINAFTDLYRAHNLVQYTSHYEQKVSAATAGAVIQYPQAIRTVVGA